MRPQVDTYPYVDAALVEEVNREEFTACGERHELPFRDVSKAVTRKFAGTMVRIGISQTASSALLSPGHGPAG